MIINDNNDDDNNGDVTAAAAAATAAAAAAADDDDDDDDDDDEHTIIVIRIIITTTMMIFALKGAISSFYNLLIRPRTVSSTYAQVTRAQLCGNHVQRIERSSRARCHIVQRGSSAIK